MAELVKYHGQVTSASSASNLQPVASRTVLVTKRGATVDGNQTVAGGGNLTVHAGGLRFATDDIVQIAGDITLIDKIASVTSDTVVVLTNGSGAVEIASGARLVNLGGDSSGGTGTPQYDGADDKVSIYSEPVLSGAKYADNKVTTDADGEYNFWAESEVVDIHIMDSSTQLGSESQTLVDVPPAFGGYPFELRTETGSDYIFDKSIWHTNQSPPIAYNNGFVGMYLRYSVDGATIEANSPQASQGLQVTLQLSGDATTNDHQALATNMQAIPGSGETIATARAASFQGQMQGDGTLTTMDSVLSRPAIGGNGSISNCYAYRAGTLLRSTGKTGTVSTSLIAFRVDKQFINDTDGSHEIVENTLTTAGSLGVLSQSRVYITEDFGDATWTGTRIGVNDTIPAQDNTVNRLGALQVEAYLHGGNTQVPTVGTFTMNYPDATSVTSGSQSIAVSIVNAPDLQPSGSTTVGSIFGLEVRMQLKGSNSNATVTNLRALDIEWPDGVLDAATYTNCRSIHCAMPNHISTSTATMTNRTGLYIDEDTQPAGATWTTSRGIDIEAPLGTNTFHARYQPISMATPATTLAAMTAAEGDMIFVTDSNNADNSGLYIYMNAAWYAWTPGGVAAAADA